ncbi:AzlC family ABC transporter permease [Kineococcus terrestris]|uniref:AzlC family ABC transporter permease n=1 Tax=Kineococcus terrestris TaxID=2044856 RepID=UPI0034DB4627
MRSFWRTPLVRDALLVAVASGVVGVAFGAVATSTGLPWWLVLLSSLVVFGGASQFLLVALLASGAGVVAAVLAALVVNVRFLPLSFAVAGSLPRGRARWLALHLVTDETVAFARARGGASAFTLLGVAQFACWNVGTLAGVLAAGAMGDTAAWGVDAAFPAALLALVLPALADRAVRRTAVAGCALAVAATPVLPAGVPVLLSLLALGPAALQLVRERGTRTAQVAS